MEEIAYLAQGLPTATEGRIEMVSRSRLIKPFMATRMRAGRYKR
jgi:hypothetical protein